MMLDKSQPWMSNHRIKVKILNLPMLASNPAMRQFQEEFHKLELVPIDDISTSEDSRSTHRRERREYI